MEFITDTTNCNSVGFSKPIIYCITPAVHNIVFRPGIVRQTWPACRARQRCSSPWKKMYGRGFVHLPSLLSFLVCVLFDTPFPHFFLFLMIFLSCLIYNYGIWPKASKHTHACVQCSPASVGLARASVYLEEGSESWQPLLPLGKEGDYFSRQH